MAQAHDTAQLYIEGMSKTGKGIKKMTEDLKQTSRKSMIIVEAKVASEEFHFAWPR